MKFTRPCGVLLAVALPFAVSGVASASHQTSLVLTIVTRDGASESVTLTCQPSGGTHPNAASACAELRRAHGNFAALPGEPEQTICTLEYQPLTARAAGRWRGDRVDWKHDYGNACTMHTVTGTVFLF
ncbi:SSI family serine proteinase inhibitor [Actinophytocola sp.]|uniref:SSI family serine proteinase inhibitor n=1 Tax=Actinophytocola sp. TaxID=1872138 RepID=UPI002D6AE85D|nr:SSI family serine proteinase inhibitor [Actinophytocola sp.]HYQ62174.1 SSI family serine proteinase inhibitor [Actinophytocola sp.]